jgi:hypothetical protein
MDHVEEPAREGFLYHLWVERPFASSALRTVDGRTVEIIEKGVRNNDAGPDFLNALVKVDEQLKRGDVEIHPVAGDWYAHGHHRDPKYNRVILHVVTLNCPAVFRTVNAAGELIPTLNMDDYLEKSAEELEQEMQADSPPLVKECALSRQNSTVIRHVIEKAGDVRFSIKSDRYLEGLATQSWDQLFYLSLLEALGYAKNQIPFRRLAEILPVDHIWSLIWNDPGELALLKSEAYLFGAAGLLPSQVCGESLPLPLYINKLEELWLDFPLRQKIVPMKAAAWQFFRLRPANFPSRRVAAAAAFICQFRDIGFVDTFAKVMNNSEASAKALIHELESMFILNGQGFWADHFSFDDERHLQPVEFALLGSERARDIVINIVLPGMFAFARESSDGRLQNTIREIYKKYPRHTPNELTRLMSRQLFGVEQKAKIVNSARLQQGLIQLSKEICQPDQCDLCLKSQR